MKLHIIMTKGLQASGKSTWAELFVKENQNYKRVNRDSIRHMLSSYTFDKPNEDLVTSVEQKIIFDLIDKEFNLVIDNMHLNEKTVESTKKIIQHYAHTEVEFEIKEFPITLAEALERDKKRPFPIGEKVIKDTYRKYEVECKQMIARAKPKNEDNENSALPICVLVDIDGTLSDSTNRRIFDDSKVYEDRVIEPVADILRTYSNNNSKHWSVKIFIMSGRQDSCKEQTEKWLVDSYIPFDDIYMRKAGDFRDDTVIKKELYEEHIKGKYRVLFVIDDRKKVVQQWVDMGLFVLDVSQDPYAKNNF